MRIDARGEMNWRVLVLWGLRVWARRPRDRRRWPIGLIIKTVVRHMTSERTAYL